MKKLLFTLLCLLLFVPSAYCTITYTYDWSSADDGSTFSGSDIEDIQQDISDQTATTAGDNSFSGTNTFAGASTFTGNVTGIASAKDTITRGFELKWGSVEQVIVNVGTLYHGTTQVNKTANVHLDVTTASDYITGVSQQTTSDWAYVYVDSSGNVKLDIAEPDKSDSAGDTDGVPLYYYYTAGTTYYRCVGAILLNATGSGEVSKFYQRSNIITWDVPINITTTQTSTAVWSNPTSCAAAVPSISTYALFGLLASDDNAADAKVFIRPSGSTWATNTANGITDHVWDAQAHSVSGQRGCALDDSQQIQYQNDTSDDATRIDVEGYTINIR